MNELTYRHLLRLAAPETILATTAFLALIFDLALWRTRPAGFRTRAASWLGAAGTVAAMMAVGSVSATEVVAGSVFVVSPLIGWVKLGLLVLTLATLLVTAAGEPIGHPGEYIGLLLLAGCGMLFLASAEELLMIFVSLELTSLSLYILAAFHKHRRNSAEAALKYFLFGGMAAAITLFGMSLLYGITGETALPDLAAKVRGHGKDPLFLLAVVMTITGFGFKVAVVPFHLWAPDAYEGAPTTSAAYIASASKVASFFVLAKVVLIGFAGEEGSAGWWAFEAGWLPLLAVMAAASVVLGNVAALRQSSVKRLLAYSAIAHAGYALLGVMAASPDGLSALLYYVLTYALTTLGAFGMVALVETQLGGDTFDHLAGLSRRAPVLSVCMLVFMLSLAGIPPLAGFFGKFYVFTAATAARQDLELLWLVILAIGMSAVSLYYYLKVLKQIFVVPSPTSPILPLPVSPTGATVIVLLAGAVLVLGAAPHLLLSRLVETIRLAGF